MISFCYMIFMFTFISYIILFLLKEFYYKILFNYQNMCTFRCFIIILSIYLIISLIKVAWSFFCLCYNEWHSIFKYSTLYCWNAAQYGFYSATYNIIVYCSKFLQYIVCIYIHTLLQCHFILPWYNDQMPKKQLIYHSMIFGHI